MDVYLSGMDGRKICKQIKEDDKTKHIPVIIFSANKSMKEVFTESGANDFIGKPFNMDELYEKVKIKLPISYISHPLINFLKLNCVFLYCRTCHVLNFYIVLLLVISIIIIR